MLCRYHKHWLEIKHPHFRMIKDWNDRDFALSVMVHFIQNPEDWSKHSVTKVHKTYTAIWRFLDYLIQYFETTEYNGMAFVERHCSDDPNDGKKGNGFGLHLVKEVCKQFEQKTG